MQKARIYSGDYEILDSGVVHLSSEEVTFSIEGLDIKLVFKDGLYEKKYTPKARDEKSLEILIENFDSPLGEGVLEPLLIGNIKNQKLYMTWFIETPNGDDNKSRKTKNRSLSYTFMVKGFSHE